MERCYQTVGILAGGRGERMEGFTIDTQKCLLKIDDEPVLMHTLKSLHEAFGSVRIIMALAYHADDVVEVVNKNLPKNVIVDYCFDNNKGTRFAYKNILEKFSGEHLLFSSGDAVAKPFVYERLVNSSIKRCEVVIAGSTDVNEADTHPLILSSNDMITSYRWPVKGVLPDLGEVRDMTIVSGRRVDLLNLINNYQDQSSVLGVFRDAVVSGEVVLSEVFGDDWLHVAYPNDLIKHWGL
jgi:CTP:molybdopterin cytidylyltransferase MocA